MLVTILSTVAFFSTAVKVVKTFYTPPLKKEDGKLVELDQETKNYQCHDLVS